MATSKQSLAQKGNWLKYRLMGSYISIPEATFLTEEERISVNAINNLRAQLIAHFDNCSKELGLKVPDHKCWCGREGKYNSTINGKYVCKKHQEF